MMANETLLENFEGLLAATGCADEEELADYFDEDGNSSFWKRGDTWFYCYLEALRVEMCFPASFESISGLISEWVAEGPDAQINMENREYRDEHSLRAFDIAIQHGQLDRLKFEVWGDDEGMMGTVTVHAGGIECSWKGSAQTICRSWDALE